MRCDELGGRMPQRQGNQLYPFENQFSPEATNSMEAGSRGGGVLPYMGYIGMCGPKGYGFSTKICKADYTV